MTKTKGIAFERPTCSQAVDTASRQTSGSQTSESWTFPKPNNKILLSLTFKVKEITSGTFRDVFVMKKPISLRPSHRLGSPRGRVVPSQGAHTEANPRFHCQGDSNPRKQGALNWEEWREVQQHSSHRRRERWRHSWGTLTQKLLLNSFWALGLY